MRYQSDNSDRGEKDQHVHLGRNRGQTLSLYDGFRGFDVIY